MRPEMAWGESGRLRPLRQTREVRLSLACAVGLPAFIAAICNRPVSRIRPCYGSSKYGPEVADRSYHDRAHKAA